jgi:PAS domain-containing protein
MKPMPRIFALKRRPFLLHILPSSSLCTLLCVVYFFVRCQGRIVHVNKAWTALTGYTLSEATGRRCEDMLAGPMTDGEEMQRCTQVRAYDASLLLIPSFPHL